MHRMRCWIVAACAMAGCVAVARAQDQASVEAGQAVYDEHCAMCHGEKLRTSGAFPDLRELGADQQSYFVQTVTEGRGQMPAWGGVLSDEEIGQLWSYIQAHAR